MPKYNKDNRERDDKEILLGLQEFLTKLESQGYAVGAFSLHGAEPSLIAPETYAEIIRMVEQHWQQAGLHNYKVNMQTNGLRITDKYLTRLEQAYGQKPDIRFGFSIDPPKEIHDKYRCQSWDRVYSNFRNTIDRGYQVSVLSVMTGATFANMPGFLEWMKYWLSVKHKNGNPYKIKVKFATGPMSPTEAHIEKFTDIIIENNMAELMQILTPGYCILSGNECMWFEFGIDGAVYSCNKAFSDENIFANWKKEQIINIINKRKKLYLNIMENPKCAECEFEALCNSGCPIDRYKSGPAAGLAHECILVRKYYGHILSKNKNVYEIFNSNY